MDVTPKKWAAVDATPEFINIKTQSGYRSCASDPLGESFYFPPDASDEILGEGVLKALAKSRMIDPKDFATFFDYRRIEANYKEWIEKTKHLYGYKTKKALFKNMNYCSITTENSFITFCPRHHEKLEGWGATTNGDEDDVIIPATSPASEVGSALRLALSRCTTKGF